MSEQAQIEISDAAEPGSQTLDDWAEEEIDPGVEPDPLERAGVPPVKGKPKKSENALAVPAFDPQTRVMVKVDGVDEEVTLDKAIRQYRRHAAADHRFQEAAAIRKQAEETMARLKADPWAALKELGLDPDKAASERILAKIEEERLASENPAELERRKLERELADERASKEEIQRKAEEIETNKKREIVRAKIDKQFTAALTEAQLPATPYTVARMADVMARNLREDEHWDATPAELAQLVREDLQTELANLAKSLGPDQLEAFLGTDALKALRKYDLERVRSPRLAGQARRVSDGEPPIRRRRPDYTDPSTAKKALDEWAEEG
jgi:hypothetical protein